MTCSLLFILCYFGSMPYTLQWFLFFWEQQWCNIINGITIKKNNKNNNTKKSASLKNLRWALTIISSWTEIQCYWCDTIFVTRTNINKKINLTADSLIMVHLSIFGIIGGAVLVALGLLMGYAVFPPVVNTKVKEVSIIE